MQSLQLPPKNKMQHLDRSPSIDRDKRLDCDGHNDMFNCDPLKLLVHNVSHADLCLTIQPDTVMGIDPERELMARPRSSRYRHVCEEITNAIKRGAKYTAVTYPDKYHKQRYVGIIFNPPPRICSWSDFRLRDPSNQSTTSQSLSCLVVRVFFPLISVILPKWVALHDDGMSWGASPINRFNTVQIGSDDDDIDIIQDQIRKREESPEIEYYSSSEKEDNNNNDEEKYESKANDNNPKLSVNTKKLSPMSAMKKANSGGSTCSLSGTDTEWEQQQSINCAYKIFLVSGSGHPLKKSSTYYQEDSTQQLSHLLCKFIRDFYPQVIVTQFYSGQDIFHYLENIKFVHSQLRPAIDNERALLARIHGKNWKKYFNLSITLCDGTPARLSAIVEGLRSFEPDMLHMFRRKSLWTHYPNVERLWEEDFEFLKFRQMTTYPAVPISEVTDRKILNIVNEMKKWKEDFLRLAVMDKQSEMSRFWLRKTHQPVLAILSVQKPNMKQPIFYRGVNAEVSMPTGSLCAERNAIGTALAADPSIRREHFQAIAVLFMAELDKNDNNNGNIPTLSEHTTLSNTMLNTPTTGKSFGNLMKVNSSQLSRRSSIFEEETDDVNPRGPCGSCTEWLKKIAQCNPSFKIITFSSRKIDDVIIKHI